MDDGDPGGGPPRAADLRDGNGSRPRQQRPGSAASGGRKRGRGDVGALGSSSGSTSTARRQTGIGSFLVDTKPAKPAAIVELTRPTPSCVHGARDTKKASMASVGTDDRISTLPDEILHHVLSFLPAHEAVPTCALARRWRHLWESAPALRVTGVKGCKSTWWFVNFVQNLLVRRDPGAHLDSFELDLDERDFDFDKDKPFLPANEWHVNRWFRHAAMACGPRVLLALRTTSGIYKDPDDYKTMELLNAPLISEHLTRLELQMVTVRRPTLDFSRCPALVDLRMEDCDIMGNISSPFLKRLSIIFGNFKTDPFRARICLPSLVSLELIGAMRRAPILVESMPQLVSAIVRLDSTCVDSCPKNEYGDCHDRQCFGCYGPGAHDRRRGQSVLLNGLCEVAELELSVYSQVFIVNRDLKLCPTFSKLKTLLLGEWCPDIASDLNVLSCFLKHSPALEKLTLQLSEVPKVPVETQRSSSPSEKSFACNHIKIVEIKCYEVDGRAQKAMDGSPATRSAPARAARLLLDRRRRWIFLFFRINFFSLSIRSWSHLYPDRFRRRAFHWCMFKPDRIDNSYTRSSPLLLHQIGNSL